MGNCFSSPNHIGSTTRQINKNNDIVVDDNKTIGPSDIWTRLQSSPQIGDWLKQVPIFCRVPEDKRNKVGGVMETMTFKSGENVFKQGDEGDRFYIIKQGIASVTINIKQENDESTTSSFIDNIDDINNNKNHNYITKEVARLKQGDYFGETALLSKAKRNATITATNGDLITLTLDSNTFKKLFKGLNVQLAKRKGVTENLNDRNNDDIDIENDMNENGLTQKSQDEIYKIIDILNNSVLFKRLNNDQKTQIAQSMRTKQFGPNEIIGEKGEILSDLFIIKQGNAIKFTEKLIKKHDGRKEIVVEPKELNTYSIIGEIGLMYNSPLQYTYKTNINQNGTQFWIINRKKFRKIVKDSSQKKFIEFENFIKTVPILESLLDFERKKIAETLEEMHFKNNHIIVKQGDIGDTFYIIRKGTAVVHKYDEGGDINDNVEVMRLGPGDFFGERALIKNDVRAATVTVTSIDGMECLFLDREAFTLLLGPLGDIMKRRIDTEYDGIDHTELSIDNNNNNNIIDISEQGINNEINFEGQLSDLSVIGTLGKGSFGHVELVQYSEKNNKKKITYYALKTVHKSHVVQLGQQEHIINEKRVLLCLTECPFIISLFTTFKDNLSVYFLLEPVLGGELFALLRDRSAFDEKTSAFYAGCVIEAFDYMHKKYIIYRDLKPENLLLTKNGYLKITDFGFAKFVTDRTWTLCGTPDYLAPEVVSGIGHNKAVDWWTLGILIYEMISSYPPFYDDDPMQTYTRIMNGNIDYPRHFSKNVIDLIKKLLQPKPTKRLGIIKGGVDNIKQHLWFKKTTKFNWDLFINQKLSAPYKPLINGPKDLSNFQEYSDDSIDFNLGGNNKNGGGDDGGSIIIDDGSGWDKEF